MDYENSDKEHIREQFAMTVWQVRNQGKLPTDLRDLQSRWVRERPAIVDEVVQVIAELNQQGITLLLDPKKRGSIAG